MTTRNPSQGAIKPTRGRVAILLVALTPFVCVAVAMAAPFDVATESFAFGALVLLGAQVLIILAMATRAQRWVSTQVDGRLKDDESSFGKHRLDPYAHEPMRRQLTKEVDAQFEKLRVVLAIQEKHHHDDIKNLTEIMKPLVDNQGLAMKVMATQMRRRPPAGEEEQSDDK